MKDLQSLTKLSLQISFFYEVSSRIFNKAKMALERSSSADGPESTHGSTCKLTSHLSASNHGEETIPSSSGISI